MATALKGNSKNVLERNKAQGCTLQVNLGRLAGW